MKAAGRDRGAAAVEFALVVPVLILIVVGIIEFGRTYNVQTTLSGAAREGVRVMALRNDPVAAKAAVKSAAAGLSLSDTQISVSPTSCTVAAGAQPPTATVTVTYRVSFLTGLLGSGITVSGKGVMRCTG
ncbi:TadE family protein [Cumulibacter manganitolerans]|uniref:TadE family protein n=1 Tax=Cumulibacter manganitolerans TaxID=1884992 RepID=UPI001295AE79|nr:TadE family protein [Cumulibacter manganitolerans]